LEMVGDFVGNAAAYREITTGRTAFVPNVISYDSG
jgi:hypothetical protein